ncbi:MAG: F0F1 ATP synthase subunit A [Prevotellaceae bacterium]|jgi:F-type H+-transporting ATPase subunit a|nr:F0F1 ATP synthase subunit A [Prevotellaceae bacterium]
MNFSTLRTKLISVFLLFATSIPCAKAQDAAKHDSAGFDMKSFIFGHISNDYEFHITDIGEHKISLPLPVILKSEDRGWFVFLSSKFHHKTESYKGFAVETEGKYKGKIMEIMPDGTKIRPIDLSISKNVFALLFTVFILSAVMIHVKRRYKRDPLKAPRGIQALLEPVILFVTNDIAKPTIGKGYEKYLDYLLTVFFFILTLNLTGLIPLFPFGANVTGNINCTAALALCTFALTMCSTGKHYWIHKLWTPGVPLWLKIPLPLMPLVEIISMFTGPIALCIRLFANILSGHMIVIVLIGLIFIFSSLGAAFGSGIAIGSVLFSTFMMALDVLVSCIQAYVFTLLSALYFSGAKHG